MQNLYVAVVVDGQLSVHMKHPNGQWITACGLDGDDDHFSVNQSTVDVPFGAQIDCTDCLAIWENAKLYSRKDFVVRKRR